MFNFIQSLQKIKVPFFSTFDVCFDLGTSNTRIAIKNKGKVLKESTYVGFNIATKEYIFFGDEAKSILGKTPEFVKIIRPVVNGVISDFDAETALVHKFMDKSVYLYLKNLSILKPQMRALACVPYIATEIEQKAVIIDIGGWLTELSIVSGGGIVVGKTLKSAGDAMNHTLAHYAYLKYGIILGEATCEYLKLNLLNFSDNNKMLTVRGKSLENGMPKSIRIKSADIKEALLSHFTQMIDGVKELIELSPPEVVDELYDRGITLCGEVANIVGLAKFLSDELKIEVITATEAEDVVIKGLLKIIQNEEDLKKLSMPKI